jgi:hypothetical protein
MNTQTQTHQLNTRLILHSPSQTPITIHAQTLTITQKNYTIISATIAFQITPEVYHLLDTKFLFNLKPELRGNFTAGKFFPSSNIQITATLKPDLLPHLTHYLNNVPTYLKNLTQSQPNHLLLSTENWLALQVKQQQTGYRTFWDYLSPTGMNPETIDSKKIKQAIFNFFKDWAESNLDTMGSAAISQSLSEVARGFDEWVDPNISLVTAESISPILKEMVKAFKQLASVSQTKDTEEEYSQIFETIVKFFTEDDWHFSKIKDSSTLRLAFQGENGKFDCYAQVIIKRSQFIFYSVSPIKVPKPKRRGVGEFISRANYSLIIGNFELDFTDGEIRYKTSIDVEGSTLTFPQIKNLVYTNVMMMDRYLPGIIAVINGDASPEAAISLIEKID